MPRALMVGMYPRVDGTPRGGPESVAEVLANGIASTGAYEVHVLTGEPGIRQQEHRTTAGGVQVHTVPLIKKLGALTGFFVDKRRLRAKMNQIQPDIVHVHGTGFWAYAALERGYPSILAIRGIGFKEASFEHGLNGARFRLGLKYHYDSMRRAKNLILLNHYTFNECSEWLSPERTEYIDNPADDAFFDVTPDEEEGRILLVAVIRRLKGHEYLIRAMGCMRSQNLPVILHCVGPVGDAEYADEIRAMIDSEGLRDCVHLLPQASREELLEHYARCSVVAVPSLVENAPLVVSEAMAAGKAIVATPAGGISEMIDDGQTGLIVPMRDADALADAISKLLRSPELRSRMGRAAKAAAEQRFRTSVSVNKTMQLYQEVLASRPVLSQDGGQ